MKKLLSALAIGLGLGLAPASAQEDCPPTPECPCPFGQAEGADAEVEPLGPTVFAIDDDEQIDEIEDMLNDILVVDETGRIVMSAEAQALLPPNVPQERVQAMLGAFVELGDDGRIRFRDREQIKPYLPMLRNFLGQEGFEELRRLRELPPGEREEALQKFLEERQQEQGGGGNPFGPGPGPGAEEEQPEPRRERPAPRERTRPEPRAERDESPRERTAPRRRGRADDERLARLEDRLERIERSLGRIEGMLEDGAGRRGRGERRRRGLFGRGPFGDRGLGGFGDMGRRARVWSDGMRRLGEILQPEDMDLLRRTLERMQSQLEPGDLQDRDQLMGKLQDSLDPQDMGRLMEIMSEFIATPEGRAMVEELEGAVARLEERMNSPEGDRLGGALERMEDMFGDGEGRLREGLERLMQGRDRDRDRAEGEHHGDRRSSRRHDDDQDAPRERRVNPPPGSKLY